MRTTCMRLQGGSCRGLTAPQRSARRGAVAAAASAHRRSDASADAADAPSRRATLALLAAAGAALSSEARPALADDQQQQQAPIAALEPMEALKDKDYGKPRMKYGDFVTTPSGLQFLDIQEGQGEPPKAGQTAVVDWSGYTIGYYGRPFEARNKPKGSSFTGDNKEFYRFKLGAGEVIPAFEEAVAGMRPGGIRRVVVPVELGYPDGNWKKLGPRPSTFAGERALDFVLSNRGMIDKTLLFNLELIRVQD